MQDLLRQGVDADYPVAWAQLGSLIELLQPLRAPSRQVVVAAHWNYELLRGEAKHGLAALVTLLVVDPCPSVRRERPLGTKA